MQLQFERHPERSRTSCALAAFFYNSLHIVHASIRDEALFIPIRSLQYLAIVDHEEVIFIDGRRRRYVNMAWQHFRPQQRNAIDEPVPYECVVYEPLEDDFVKRLRDEFYKAIEDYRKKHLPASGGASVIPLKKDEGSQTN